MSRSNPHEFTLNYSPTSEPKNAFLTIQLLVNGVLTPVALFTTGQVQHWQSAVVNGFAAYAETALFGLAHSFGFSPWKSKEPASPWKKAAYIAVINGAFAFVNGAVTKLFDSSLKEMSTFELNEINPIDILEVAGEAAVVATVASTAGYLAGYGVAQLIDRFGARKSNQGFSTLGTSTVEKDEDDLEMYDNDFNKRQSVMTNFSDIQKFREHEAEFKNFKI